MAAIVEANHAQRAAERGSLGIPHMQICAQRIHKYQRRRVLRPIDAIGDFETICKKKTHVKTSFYFPLKTSYVITPEAMLRRYIGVSVEARLDADPNGANGLLVICLILRSRPCRPPGRD